MEFRLSACKTFAVAVKNVEKCRFVTFLKVSAKSFIIIKAKRHIWREGEKMLVINLDHPK